MRKIKLIWDFRGNDTLKMAQHHAVHLKEFALKEKLHFYDVDTAQYSDFYATAFIIVDEADMVTYRNALKPHRGEVA